MSRVRDHILRGTRASQPAATTVSVGSLYGVTDEGNKIERSNGTTWDAYGGIGTANGGYIGVKGADIASASTTDLATATGDWVDITGTTTITAFGTVTAGVERLLRFTGILTLTHNGTSLILPTAANITTAAGDFARFRSLGSGNWVCVAYQRASGAPLTGGGGGASTTQTGEMLSGFIATVANKDYRLVVKAAHGGTITEATTRSESGTCTATFKINTTALGGTANSVSSTEQSQAHASSNVFVAGDDIVITASSNSSCLGLSFTLQYTRTLA